MRQKPIIWIMDTSIFTIVLNIPKYNHEREVVLQQFEERIAHGDLFLMPYAAIIEAGNPIAKIDKGLRRPLAQRFVDQVKMALNGQAPWKPIKFPAQKDLMQWLDDFPNQAEAQKGFGDFSILKDWEAQCQLFPNHSSGCWTREN